MPDQARYFVAWRKKTVESVAANLVLIDCHGRLSDLKKDKAILLLKKRRLKLS